MPPDRPPICYEDQKPEAFLRAVGFRAQWLPKFLNYFSAVLDRNGPFVAGSDRS